MGDLEDDIHSATLKKALPKIYKRSWLDACLFSWVRAQKNLVPNISIDKAIARFYKEFDITESDYPLRDCQTTYTRMNQEYYDAQKSKESK